MEVVEPPARATIDEAPRDLAFAAKAANDSPLITVSLIKAPVSFSPQ